MKERIKMSRSYVNKNYGLLAKPASMLKIKKEMKRNAHDKGLSWA